jgi:hypothetical protein
MKRALLVLMAWLCVVSVSSAANFKVLILAGDARHKESPILTALTKVGPHAYSYEEVLIEGAGFDKNLRGANIIWFPWNAPGHDGKYFLAGAEDTILKFVEGGGGVWISAFDDNYKDASGQQVGGWIPGPIKVQNTGDSEVEITAEGDKSGLFSTPNKVDMNAPTLDDNFADVGAKWVLLAKRKDNQGVAAAYLPHGKGVYLEACIDTRDDARAAAAKPLIENALLWLGNWLAAPTAVEPGGKLAATWAAMKTK